MLSFLSYLVANLSNCSFPAVHASTEQEAAKWVVTLGTAEITSQTLIDGELTVL